MNNNITNKDNESTGTNDKQQQPMARLRNKKGGPHIRYAAIILTAIAQLALISADVAHTSSSVLLRSVAGFSALLWTGPLVILAGLQELEGYRICQPFSGGSRFLLSQAFGWCLFALALLIGAVGVANAAVASRLPHGTLTGVGLMGTAAQCLFQFSLSHFRTGPRTPMSSRDISSASASPVRKSKSQPSTPSSSSRQHGQTQSQPIGQTRTRSSSMVLMAVPSLHLGVPRAPFIVACVCAVLIVAVEVVRSDVLYVVGISGILLSTLVTQTEGYLKLRRRGFSVFQPFRGGDRFALLQGFGWAFFGLKLNLLMVIPWPSHPQSQDVVGLYVALASLSLSAEVALAFSLAHFVALSAETRTNNVGINKKNDERGLTPSGSLSGHTLLFIAKSSTLLSLPMYALLLARWQFPQTVESMVPHSTISNETLSILCLFIWILATPIAHIGGSLARGLEGYMLYQPFVGGVAHVSLQAFGWMLYSFSGFFALVVRAPAQHMDQFGGEVFVDQDSQALLVSSKFEGTVRWFGPAFLGAVVTIYLSVYMFEPSVMDVINTLTPSSNKPTTTSEKQGTNKKLNITNQPHKKSDTPCEKKQHPHLSKLKTINRTISTQKASMSPIRRSVHASAPLSPRDTWWKGDSRLGTALAVLGFLVGSAADIWRTSVEPSLQVPMQQLAVLLHVASAVVVHVGASRAVPGYRLFHPFAGPPAFVVHQALSWTIFGVCLMTQIIVVGAAASAVETHTSERDNEINDAVDSSPNLNPVVQMGWLTLTSLGHTFAHFLLRGSLSLLPSTPTSIMSRSLTSTPRSTRQVSHNSSSAETSALLSPGKLSNRGTRDNSFAASNEAGVQDRVVMIEWWRSHIVGVVAGVVSAVCAHLSLGLFLLAEWLRFASVSWQSNNINTDVNTMDASWTMSLTWHTSDVRQADPAIARSMAQSVLNAPAGVTYMLAMILAVFGVLCTHVLSGPLLHLNARGMSSLYHVFQPFRGGLAFVLLQGIGWCMLGAGVVTGLTSLRYGAHRIPIAKLTAGNGVLLYVSQLLLLTSLGWFDPSSDLQNHDFSNDDDHVSNKVDVSKNDHVENDDHVSKNEDINKNDHVSNVVESDADIDNVHEDEEEEEKDDDDDGDDDYDDDDDDADQGRGLGAILSFGGMSLFLMADVAMLRFGLTADVMLPVLICALLAVIVSVPVALYFDTNNDSECVEDDDQSEGEDCGLVPGRLSRSQSRLGTFVGLSSYFRQQAGSRQVIPKILGMALWTFTVLLGLLVIAGLFQGTISESDKIIASHGPEHWLLVYLYTIVESMLGFNPMRSEVDESVYTEQQQQLSRGWLGSTTGFAGFLAHGLIFLGRSAKTTVGGVHVLTASSGAIVASFTVLVVAVFSWAILPWLRVFIDWPMYYYALVMKRKWWWVSPDAMPVLQDVHVRRNIRYGTRAEEVLDVLIPLNPIASKRALGLLGRDVGTGSSFVLNSKNNSSNSNTRTKNNENNKLPAPVLYCHGGGHICVTREVLHQSITPLCRAGVAVYAVEYPLSPEARFPDPVLSLLKAMRWVAVNHCSNGCNDAFSGLTATSNSNINLTSTSNATSNIMTSGTTGIDHTAHTSCDTCADARVGETDAGVGVCHGVGIDGGDVGGGGLNSMHDGYESTFRKHECGYDCNGSRGNQFVMLADDHEQQLNRQQQLNQNEEYTDEELHNNTNQPDGSAHMNTKRLCVHCAEPLGCESVQLFGDSAGGNLVSMAALLVSNPVLVQELSEEAGLPDLAFWKFPTIERLCCLYGLLSQRSVLTDVDTTGHGEADDEVKNSKKNYNNNNNNHISVAPSARVSVRGVIQVIEDVALKFVFSLYAPKPSTYSTTRAKRISYINKNTCKKRSRKAALLVHRRQLFFRGRLTLTDFSDDQLENFVPDTLLICGRSDPLIHGNREALAMLQRTNHACRLVEYPGTHAFHGLPPQWTFGSWVHNALPATYELMEFFSGGLWQTPKRNVVEDHPPCSDYTPLLVIPLCLLALAAAWSALFFVVLYVADKVFVSY